MYRYGLSTLLTTLMLTGCAGPTAHLAPAGAAAPNRDHDLEARAERVFREQNRVESTLMFLLPALKTDKPAEYQSLKAAEEQMMTACEPLNEAALKHQQQQSIGLLQRLSMPSVIADCAAATERVERLLRERGHELLPQAHIDGRRLLSSAYRPGYSR